jgi:Family of unknown function (DUF6035)
MSPKHLDAISASRFRGRQVSELHVRLMLSLEYICRNSDGFENTGAPDETYFNLEKTSHRFPDLQTTYLGRRVVFELQLSQTYLPVVADREVFYRHDGTILIWLSNRFELKKFRQTERDILAVRSLQIFEISEETILQSFRNKTLYLDAFYQERNFIHGDEIWEWKEQRIEFSELKFDEYLVEYRIFDPWTAEAEMLRTINMDDIKKFEKYWKSREEWNSKLSSRLLERFRKGIPFDESQTGEALKIRAIETLLAIAKSNESAKNAIEKLGFELVVDALFVLRDNENHRNKQDAMGIFATTLDQRPHFTDALLGVAFAYSQSKILENSKLMAKAKVNLVGSGARVSTPQCHEFDKLLALIFPKAASYLNASALPYLLSLVRAAAIV